MSAKIGQGIIEDDEPRWTVALFEKVKEYLRTAKKGDPPVIGTTENFCEPNPPRAVKKVGMVVTATPPAPQKSPTMEDALSDSYVPGAADLVNKLIGEESDE